MFCIEMAPAVREHGRLLLEKIYGRDEKNALEVIRHEVQKDLAFVDEFGGTK